MSGLRGSLDKLKNLSALLRRLPVVVGQKVATAVATPLTSIVQGDFDASEDPYGIPWAPGVDGEKVTLRETGALARGLTYVAIGRKLRMRLGVPYAKYQVGKRRVAPAQGAVLPTTYSNAIGQTANAVVHAELGGTP